MDTHIHLHFVLVNQGVFSVDWIRKLYNRCRSYFLVNISRATKMKVLLFYSNQGDHWLLDQSSVQLYLSFENIVWHCI